MRNCANSPAGDPGAGAADDVLGAGAEAIGTGQEVPADAAVGVAIGEDVIGGGSGTEYGEGPVACGDPEAGRGGGGAGDDGALGEACAAECCDGCRFCEGNAPAMVRAAAVLRPHLKQKPLLDTLPVHVGQRTSFTLDSMA